MASRSMAGTLHPNTCDHWGAIDDDMILRGHDDWATTGDLTAAFVSVGSKGVPMCDHTIRRSYACHAKRVCGQGHSQSSVS